MHFLKYFGHTKVFNGGGGLKRPNILLLGIKRRSLRSHELACRPFDRGDLAFIVPWASLQTLEPKLMLLSWKRATLASCEPWRWLLYFSYHHQPKLYTLVQLVFVVIKKWFFRLTDQDYCFVFQASRSRSTGGWRTASSCPNTLPSTSTRSRPCPSLTPATTSATPRTTSEPSSPSPFLSPLPVSLNLSRLKTANLIPD